ncbi:MAG: hypothetical protein FJX86_00315 [Bacteroidetes bacterium]|nr:hypothetical protein [Bacteroidota bacterium]
MPRTILIISRFIAQRAWLMAGVTLLELSDSSAQSLSATASTPRITWSAQELTGFMMDSSLFHKWIRDLDTLDRDTSAIFAKMVQPSIANGGQEINTGGVGYPAYALWWNPTNRLSSMNHHGIFSGSMHPRHAYYFPKIPLTRVEFQAGGNNLQILQLNHHQQIGPTLSAGIQFRSITHDGFLQRSGSNFRNSDLYLVGSLRPGRHFMTATYQALSAELSENGGIASPGLPSASGYNPLNLNIQLRNANSMHQEECWSLENRWSWRAHQPQAPRLVHLLRKETQRWKFADEAIANNLAFYPSASDLKDSSSAKDSLRQSTWTHRLGMEHQFSSGHLLQYGLELSHLNYYSGLTHPAANLEPSNALRSDFGWLAYGRWESQRQGLWVDWRQGFYHSYLPLMSALKIGWQASVSPEGLDSADARNKTIPKRFLNRVTLEAFVDPPTYAQRWMITNSTDWNLPELQAAQGIILSSEGGQPGQALGHWTLRVGLMRNLIGLGIVTTDSISLQFGSGIRSLLMSNNREAVAYLGLRAKGRVQTGSLGQIQWSWNYHHLWQWSNNPTWVPLPLWSCDDWLYIQRRTLAGWTWLAGLALRYQTPFVAPHYRPELGMWTLAMPTWEGNQVNTVSGNYPWIDLLAGIRVQKTLLYVRWEHANMGWPAQIGQWVPGYPLGDRRLRFGLDWKFLD